MEEIERFEPGMAGAIWYEHWHRYHFVAPLAEGRVTIDAACGEGYGSALLAKHAARVTGIDLSTQAIALARRRYGSAANLEYVEGRCEALPVADASADLFVSFETLEHLQSPRALVSEVARVLRPGGVFVVSTPNKALYSDATGYRNPYHPSELYEAQFLDLLHERFPAVTLFGQRVDAYSAIWPIDAAPAQAQLVQAASAGGGEAAPGLPDPLYFIALCTDSPAALAGVGGNVSLLADRDHRVSAVNADADRQLGEMRAHVERIEAAYLASQKQLAALAKERDALAAQLQAPGARTWQKPR
jgi:ubiquinone/menaquinone biosynthesis C-methylase UbiE